jgi:hypothetical protein
MNWPRSSLRPIKRNPPTSAHSRFQRRIVVIAGRIAGIDRRAAGKLRGQTGKN